MGDLAPYRRFNLVVAGIGVLVFSAALWLVQFEPKAFERLALDFATQKVQERVQASPQYDFMQNIADNALTRLTPQMQSIAEDLERDMPALIASVVASNCSCDGRQAYANALRQQLKEKYSRFDRALTAITDASQSKYASVRAELRADLRIFLATNLIVFAFAFGASLFKRQAARHLVPICGLLLVSVVLGTAWYIFGQDWIMVIAFNDYMGTGYSIGVGLLFLLLLDILFNQAVVTSAIFSTISDALGSAITFSPC